MGAKNRSMHDQASFASPPTPLRSWLEQGDFALGMSSGFFGFFAHTGMLQALEEEGFVPRAVAGSSAGALVGGAWASGMSPRDLAEELFRLRREDFWDPSPGFGVLRGRLFRERLIELLAVSTIEQCRVPLRVSVTDVLSRRVRVLHSGDLATAIHASCAVPIMFHPVRHQGRVFTDGGVVDRPGIAGLIDEPRVLYHHLASRSPWRSKKSIEVPRRAGLRPLVLEGLPRSGPFKLHEGRRALQVAYEATKRALDQS